MFALDHLMARGWVRLHSGVMNRISRRVCYGLHDGGNLKEFVATKGEVPVLFAIPAMSDVNGALPHPGVRVLQTILRHQGIACEVINYNLPVIRPQDPFEHLIEAVRTLKVKILGVSTYSQAIRNSLEGLQRLKQACPDVTVVLGGPHPTESYLSLMGVSFIDYVCRGEAEESFPALAHQLLAGERPEPASIPGVYSYDRQAGRVDGVPASFIDVRKFDEHQLLRYQFSPDELKQQRLYRGCHGTAGAAYWPVALVRGCPYDCTFCAAYQMSGKKLRYRAVNAVVDDLQFFQDSYGVSHFSFIDDAFTQQYEYVVDLCQEIERRKLTVYWTTDNGIRYETLGQGRPLEAYLKKRGIDNVDELIELMIRAGWRGTAIGLESGAARVRRELVRKGGAPLDNEQIIANLQNLKRISRRMGVYFYINGFMMAGFPQLTLKNGKVVPAETEEEMEQTRQFTMRLRESGAVDMMNLSIVIPLPATDMWDGLTIREKVHVLTGCVPADHPERGEVDRISRSLLERYGDDLDATRYRPEPEEQFWKEIYRLSDGAQILVMQSFDAFNADSAHMIDLKRPDPEFLWNYREQVVSEFYDGISMKLRMLLHVLRRSRSPQDVFAYLTLMGRKYDPETKGLRAGASGGAESRPS